MKDTKLKVMHLIWWGEIGGISLNLVDLVSEIKNIQNYICLLSKGGAAIPILSARSEKLFELKVRSGFNLRGAYRMIRLLNNTKVDLIHVHSPTYFVAIALFLIKRKTPVVFQEHGRLQQKEYRAKAKLFYKLFQRLFSCFISISENTKRSMVHIGIPSDKIVVVNNPVNSSIFKPELNRSLAKICLGITEDAQIIGTACRLAPEKDLGLFLRTAKVLSTNSKNTIFVIIGGGNQKERLIKQAKKLGIMDRTRFIGFRSDMVSVWRAFDVFLFTSISEAFGRTLLESLSCETPIVAAMPMTGGAIDIIKRCPGIINTGGRNEHILAQAVQELLTSEEKRNLLGRLGRGWVIERYDIKKWAEQMKQIYYSLFSDLKSQ